MTEFQQRGPAGCHVLLDFDRTLTCANAEGVDFYTWTIMESFLPPEFIQPSSELYQTYRPLELRGELTQAKAAEWWNASLSMFQRAGVNLYEVEREFVSRANIRPGVTELFALCQELRIPIVILSAGITNIIEMWCRHYGLQPDLILSTRLQLTPDGFIAGWSQDELIHVLNKRERGHGQLTTLQAERPYTVVVGDSLDDAAMVEGDEKVLRMRVYDPRADEHDDDAAQAATMEKFDVMVKTGSFEPVVELLRKLSYSAV
jgi:HAD superfamily phosphoserine phosphatase-like hydrolase